MTALVYFETTGEQHLAMVGGVSALERRIRQVAKEGAKKVVVAAPRVELVRPAPIEVEFVEPGTGAPEGARVERADVIAGIELVDAEACAAAEWKVLRTMNKSYEGLIDALINWRFSMRITRWLSHRSLAITPNHVTIAAILLGSLGGVLVMTGAYWGMAVGGVLIQVNNVLDSVDGELARFRFQYSKVGQWLDNLSDDIVDNLFIAACGVVLGGAWMWIGIGAAAGRVLTSVATYVDVYARTGTGDVFAFRYWFESGKQTADEVYNPKQISTWLRALGRRDTFTFTWMIACLAAFPYWVVVHGAVIGGTTVGLLVLHFTVFRKQRSVAR
jgi:phosphatidylglycerophosphate synthase